MRTTYRPHHPLTAARIGRGSHCDCGLARSRCRNQAARCLVIILSRGDCRSAPNAQTISGEQTRNPCCRVPGQYPVRDSGRGRRAITARPWFCNHPPATGPPPCRRAPFPVSRHDLVAACRASYVIREVLGWKTASEIYHLTSLATAFECTVIQPLEQGDTGDDKPPQVMMRYAVPASNQIKLGRVGANGHAGSWLIPSPEGSFALSHPGADIFPPGNYDIVTLEYRLLRGQQQEVARCYP